MYYLVEEDVRGLVPALDRICMEAANAVKQGYRLIVLSDRKADHDRVAIRSVIYFSS